MTALPRVPRLAVRDLGVSFGSLEAIRDVSLHVDDGEFVSILGPSGSGKSTTFSVLTGAVAPSRGEVLVDGAPLAGRRDHFAYMPQRDGLLPWRRLIDNVTLGLETRGVKRAEARARVAPLLKPFGLAGFERSYPAQLSGGMRQRAALLRTIAQERSVLLLDEPFGALDALTRAQMQRFLAEQRDRFGWTVLLVTHDVREAVGLSDRVYVFSPRPAMILRQVPIDLPRPRTPGTLAGPAAAAIEADLLETLLETRMCPKG